MDPLLLGALAAGKGVVMIRTFLPCLDFCSSKSNSVIHPDGINNPSVCNGRRSFEQHRNITREVLIK